jgi:hypothetical protein
VVEVMSACDSVRCAVERFEAVSMAGTWNGQFLFGDRFGASAIVEPLTIIPTEGSFQVATNFFQSEVPPAERTDDRYVTATSMLAEVDAFSPEVMRDVLAATRQQGQVTTVYSTVYELDSGVIHLYYFGDFETEVTFDIGAELAKGVHGYEIGTLVASNEPATARALPIRRRLEAIKDGLPTSAVDPASLVGLAGTYEAPPYLTVIVEATGDGLAVRHPWTPPVPLTALSPSEFAFAYSDFDGTAHDERLHFRAAGLGGPGQVRIEEDGTDTVVATLGGGSAASWPAMVLLLGVLLAGGSVGWWMRAHRRPEGSASVHSAPSRRRTIPTPHDARPRPLLPGMRHPRS